MEPPTLDAGRHGAAKHGAGKHHGKHRQPTVSMGWLWGFTILGVTIVGGGMAYYFASQDANEPTTRGKADRPVAKAIKTTESDGNEPDGADDTDSESIDVPAPKQKAGARDAKKKSTMRDEQQPAIADDEASTAPDEPAVATKKPKAKSSAPAPAAAKPKEPGEKSAQATVDPESESWKLDGMSHEITGTLSNGDGLLGENKEATTGKFLVLTLSITPKNRDKIPPVSLKDVTLTINAGGQERRNLRPYAVGNNDQGERFFTFLPEFIGDAHLVCGSGECKLARAAESEPVTLMVTVSPCRMSFVYHIPDPDKSEFAFRFVDTVIRGTTDNETAAVESDAPDTEPPGEP